MFLVFWGDKAHTHKAPFQLEHQTDRVRGERRHADTYKVCLGFLFVLRTHVVVDEADVGMIQHRVVVTHVHKQTWETGANTVGLQKNTDTNKRNTNFILNTNTLGKQGQNTVGLQNTDPNIIRHTNFILAK